MSIWKWIVQFTTTVTALKKKKRKKREYTFFSPYRDRNCSFFKMKEHNKAIFSLLHNTVLVILGYFNRKILYIVPLSGSLQVIWIHPHKGKILPWNNRDDPISSLTWSSEEVWLCEVETDYLSQDKCHKRRKALLLFSLLDIVSYFDIIASKHRNDPHQPRKTLIL